MINLGVTTRHARFKREGWQDGHHHGRKHEVSRTVRPCLGEQMVCLIVVVANRSVLARRKPLIRPLIAHVLSRRGAKTRTSVVLVANPLNALIAARTTRDGRHRVRGHVKPEGEQAEPSDQRMDKWSAH